MPTMFRVASLVGEAIRSVHRTHAKSMSEQSVSFDVSILLGGQLLGRTMRLFPIYAAGNFIKATGDTPFLRRAQVRQANPRSRGHQQTSLDEGVKLASISMEMTLRSNLRVGMPLDVLVYRNDGIDGTSAHRITEQDPYFAMILERWSAALAQAHRDIDPPQWLGDADEK